MKQGKCMICSEVHIIFDSHPDYKGTCVYCKLSIPSYIPIEQHKQYLLMKKCKIESGQL